MLTRLLNRLRARQSAPNREMAKNLELLKAEAKKRQRIVTQL